MPLSSIIGRTVEHSVALPILAKAAHAKASTLSPAGRRHRALTRDAAALRSAGDIEGANEIEDFANGGA